MEIQLHHYYYTVYIYQQQLIKLARLGTKDTSLPYPRQNFYFFVKKNLPSYHSHFHFSIGTRQSDLTWMVTTERQSQTQSFIHSLSVSGDIIFIGQTGNQVKTKRSFEMDLMWYYRLSCQIYSKTPNRSTKCFDSSPERANTGFIELGILKEMAYIGRNDLKFRGASIRVYAFIRDIMVCKKQGKHLYFLLLIRFVLLFAVCCLLLALVKFLNVKHEIHFK